MELDNKQKTGIIYCRVSSKEQVEGTSLDMQERLCREYARREHIDIVHEPFIDRGESAKTVDRPEFMKAIAFCSNKKRQIGYFIVYKIDRFARNQDDHVTIRATLKRFGTELRSVTEPINETPMGRAMEGVLSVFAEFDNNVRTERTRNGMIERIKKGIWVWPAPLGYHRLKEGENITPEVSTAPFIQLCFEEYAKGRHTYLSLARFLADRGLRTRTGKRPSAQLVEKIIKNPIYYGLICGLGLEEKGAFTPLIPEELFNRCQEGYKQRSRNGGVRTKENPAFPLRRITCCALCGGNITGSFSRGRHGGSYPYYHHNKQGCDAAHFIPKETLEQAFIECLDAVVPSKRFEKIFKAVILDIWKANYKKMDEANAELNKEVEKLEQERQRVFDLHRSGTYTDEDFLEQKKLINSQITAKRQLYLDNHIEEFNMEEALNYCFQFVRSASEAWVRFKNPSTRVRFQNMLLREKLSFDGKKFGTPKMSRIFELSREFQGKASTLVALVRRDWNPLVWELSRWLEFGQEAQKAEETFANVG